MEKAAGPFGLALFREHFQMKANGFAGDFDYP
jgi:hypothetical protein